MVVSIPYRLLRKCPKSTCSIFERRMNSNQVATLFLFFLMLLSAATVVSGADDTDHLALMAIKSRILHDPQGVLSSWNDSLHICQWQGVACGRRHSRVIALDLSSGGLTGSLSPYVGNLSFLRELQLQNNTFGGGIPPEIGHLFRLQLLRLDNNSLQGEIPANLSRCNNLRFLVLGFNMLVGRIPVEFSSLLMLRSLSIHHNNLSGGIPPFIGNFTSLETISLSACYLGGSIPNVFHRLTSLRLLLLGGNNLVGTIPSNIYNLSSLLSFSLAGNQLEGSLPTNLCLMLPRLEVIQVWGNRFTGSLPPSISNCSELQSLEAGDNFLNGKVAIDFGNLQNLAWVSLYNNNLENGEHDEINIIDSLSNCSNLQMLDLQKNKFQVMLPNSLGNFSAQLQFMSLDFNSFYGSIPSSVGSLVGLGLLNLAENRFTGTIPTSIGNLQNLQRLVLQNNNFSGKLPDSIGNLSSLLELDLSRNNLEGTIPLSIGNCQNLYFLSLYQNNLSGSIPRQIFELASLSFGLDLASNHLSGPLPEEVGRLTNLQQLSLFENNLSGELPSGLGGCSSLYLLYLGGNFFHGSIPRSMSSLRGLQHLNLSHNNFSGPVPRYLEEFHLEELDISFNSFEGEVPIKGIFANTSAISIVGNNQLCGGMPDLLLQKCIFIKSKRRRKLSLAVTVVISIASVIVGLAIVAVFLFCWRTKKKKDQPSGLVLKEGFLKVSYERLLKATDGFSSENLIGVGAFASVYKGIFHEDGLFVAVKVLNLQHRGGFKSFVAECEALRHLRHRNLVKVLTCCSSIDFQGNDFRALVYEFMPNGSLERWLHSSPSAPDEPSQLSLLQRVSIALDVACALDYLHHHSENPIIHCDIKPSNILLDNDMVAHVGDFGLARFLFPELSNANPDSTAGLQGTIGYAPPEYGLGNEVSTNGDVYSYGILLLEMVMGKRPTDPLFQEGLNLPSHARTVLAKRDLGTVEEPMLPTDKNGEECLISMLKIGVECCKESPQDRMDISRVIQELHLLREKHSL